MAFDHAECGLTCDDVGVEARHRPGEGALHAPPVSCQHDIMPDTVAPTGLAPPIIHRIVSDEWQVTVAWPTVLHPCLSAVELAVRWHGAMTNRPQL